MIYVFFNDTFYVKKRYLFKLYHSQIIFVNNSVKLYILCFVRIKLLFIYLLFINLIYSDHLEPYDLTSRAKPGFPTHLY